MTLKYELREEIKLNKDECLQMIKSFNTEGITVDDRGRNTIKKFELPELEVNVKSFKRPHLINSFAYKYIRKSKARRSYEYGLELLKRGLNTPDPLAYFEYSNALGVGKSYYFSRHLNYDYTFFDLREKYEDPFFRNILREFSKFAFDLHEKGVYHKDLSAGNILITCSDQSSSFNLIDLNRMKFIDMDLNLRMQNLNRLTEDVEVMKIIAEEYAAVSKWSYDEILKKMEYFTLKLRSKYNFRTRMKRRLLGRKQH
jgi:tRNA A-37 threonylcarbamoyl transferase component Bud32